MIQKLNKNQLQNVSGGGPDRYTKHPDGRVTVYFIRNLQEIVITYNSWSEALLAHPNLGSFSPNTKRSTIRILNNVTPRALNFNN